MMEKSTEHYDRLSILIIEDNPGDALLIEEMLKEISPTKSCSLIFSTRLSEGLHHVNSSHIDLILLDLHLPDSDSLTTYQSVRIQAPSTPVIALTGMADENFALSLLRNGVQDYLLKDEINSRSLNRSIRYSLERMRIQQENEKLIGELQNALQEVRRLSGMLPICSFCKKIRDDKGYWNQIEAYLAVHSEAQFTHSVCQECARKHYPDLDLYEK